MFLEQIIPQDTLSVLRELTESKAFYITMVYPAEAAIITGIILYLLITRQKFIKRIAGSIIKFLIKTGDYFKRQRAETEVKNVYNSFKTKKINTLALLDIASMVLGGLILIAILTKTLFLAMVTTQSMAPLIMPGDIVLTEAFTKDVSVGDVVVFIPPGGDRMFVHRVTSVLNGISTKGDNAPPDSWKLAKSDIKGKAISINQKPLVIKGLSYYFMPINDPGIESDPTYKNVRNTINVVQTYGPIISIMLMLFSLLTLVRK